MSVTRMDGTIIHRIWIFAPVVSVPVCSPVINGRPLIAVLRQCLITSHFQESVGVLHKSDR